MTLVPFKVLCVCYTKVNPPHLLPFSQLLFSSVNLQYLSTDVCFIQL